MPTFDRYRGPERLACATLERMFRGSHACAPPWLPVANLLLAVSDLAISILISSLAWDIARCSVKRRPKASVGVVIELRKIADQDADSLVSRRKAKRQSRYLRVTVRSCVVVRARAR